MSSSWRSLYTVLAGLCLCSCGNYSNDDLDFQLALPEQSDMEAKMQLSLVRDGSAEYYVATRKAITTFNDLVTKLTGLIDLVRGTTPTSRAGDQRTWGPWPVDKVPTWEVEVVMQRSAVSESLLRIDYWVLLRPRGTDESAWVPFLTGNYTSSGSARIGQGEIGLWASDARNAGYPINDDPGLAELDYLKVTYNNSDFPIGVSLEVQYLATATSFAYLQNQDGSGQMTFDWEGRSDTGVPVTASMLSRWIGSGAGRADLIADLTPNRSGVITTLGIDCWGVDTVATYSYRIGDNSPASDQSSCLF